MTTEQTSAAPEATDASSSMPSPEQATQRTYTQQEFDDAMAKMKAAVMKKAMRPLEELGDIDELRRLKTDAERRQQEEAVKRGEFERILQDLAAKKDAEIARRDRVIQEYRVDTPLVTAAARMKSVNPEQVRSLLRSQVRLNAEGDVEVVDSEGQIRYSDSGQPLGVDDLVTEFLSGNPHFVQPTPSTTNSRSSITAPSPSRVDITKLDMRNPEHRAIYREYRKSAGITR